MAGKSTAGHSDQVARHGLEDEPCSGAPAGFQSGKSVLFRNLHFLLIISFKSMILTTRPVLLHLLKMRKGLAGHTPATAERVVSETVQAVAEACIWCAQHSYSIIVDSWIEGLFKTFDYFMTQYLFSAATVIAISSLLGGNKNVKDREDFEFSGPLLEKLRGSSSFAAIELCHHIEAIDGEIRRFLAAAQVPDDEAHGTEADNDDDLPSNTESVLHMEYCMTSEMALAEPSLEMFLMQNEQSLADVGILLDHSKIEGLYWPPYDAM